MEHNLEDSLNLEGDIGGMDFDHSEDAAEITLESSNHGGDIPMEFETMEDKQAMLMDTGSEEVIDFMGDQLTLQEYSIGDDQTSEITTTEELNIQNILQTQSDTMVDLQFEPKTVTPISVRQETATQPKYIAVKVAIPNSANKRGEPAVISTVSRQVAIAPKPPKFVQTVARGVFPGGKQYAIAPKPVALITNKTAISKGLSGIMPTTNKGQQVLAQVGKQLIMVPSGSQKIKLVPASQAVQFVRGDPDQAHLTPNKVVTTTSQGAKTVMAKVVVQGANQPAVITKLMPGSSSTTPQTRYVMQQKTVPISIGNNKFRLSSPTKQGKKQVITLKSAPGLTPIQPVTTTKKVVITANPAKQKVIVKAAPQSVATAQLNEGKFVLQSGQRTQLHKIDVPGKGIQLIRLVTNPKKSNQAPALNISSKNLISLTEKAMAQKPQQKFVRIAPAPVASKSSASQPLVRSGQSLLTPMSAAEPASAELTCKLEPRYEDEEEPQQTELAVREESKSALAALIADAVADDHPAVEIEYGEQPSPNQDESTNSMDQTESSFRSDEHPLIVIPASYLKQNDSRDNKDEQRRIDIRFDADEYNSFQSPTTPPPASEPDSAELAMRPRKACNCTKSQCLKLYCDCFANGEFCNRCNCNNCHNNLDNEELRQKSIRACLLRNPNAFRPKIGKSKTGGPEIIRRHNKGCNCKRSGCLKNYCECYEAKIACTGMCKCVGCRNVEEGLGRGPRRDALLPAVRGPRRDAALHSLQQPCSFMTSEVIEAVCQCLVAAADAAPEELTKDPVADVVEEFARCLQDIISASLQAAPPVPPAPPSPLETQT
ncbi:protein lin-54 homolog isoform X2 [Plodia interpunctella]|uniref:protein lin-54 homolog isoform X2 n=1 Tax=Plodia interpunctella TaxID=58824 RepID=UPI002367B90C|nr:protein lin-54 homolog isoform X2 [Plodia interpunctella]